MSWIPLTSAQSLNDNFKVEYPRLVHQGKPFEVSIITSNEIIAADQLNLKVVPQQGIIPAGVIVHTDNSTRATEFENSFVEGFLNNVATCSVNLPKSNATLSGSFFQIIMIFNSEMIDYSEIDFYGEFRKDNKVVDYLNNTSEDLLSDYPNYHRLKINFYTSNGNDEKSLLLKPNSEFSISPSFSIDNNLLVELWLNLNQKGFPFFEIKNKQTGLTEYSLTNNEFQILIPESDFKREIKVMPHFVPNNSWTHLAILFLTNRNEVEFYSSGKQIAVFELDPSFSVNDLLLSFINNSEGSFQVDQLRILDFNEPIESSFKNSNFDNFLSTKSKIKLQFNFNRTTISELMRQGLVHQNNVMFVKSDAPIFSRAPELNLNIMSNFYELSWLGGDFTNASKYILERAEGEKGYDKIYTVEADNSEEKTYTFLSERKTNAEIIYFRIKQINKDGSVIYSSQVKVGQGELEEFIVKQNYPNPFNPKTQISIEVLIDAEFEITVYNLEGKRIAVLYDGFLTAGEHNFTFDASDLPSGIYLYKASSMNFSQTKKMILAK